MISLLSHLIVAIVSIEELVIEKHLLVRSLETFFVDHVDHLATGEDHKQNVDEHLPREPI